MEEILKEITTFIKNQGGHRIEAMDKLVSDSGQITQYYKEILAELKKINAKSFVEIRRNE